VALARTGEPERVPTDRNGLVREVMDVIEPPSEVSIHLDLAPDLPVIAVDRAQLFQVLENLVRNAIQAMSEGGIVAVSTHQSAEGCSVYVSDTGPGIPLEVQ